MKKWNRPCTAIKCHFHEMASYSSDSDMQNGAEMHPIQEIHLSKKIITRDLVSAIEISESPERLILRDCTISDNAVFEILFGLPVHNFLTLQDLGGTKLGGNAGHIRWIIALGNLKVLCLPHCKISLTALYLLLPALSSCKNLIHGLSHNNLEERGIHVAKSIMAWGHRPNLKEINLSHCSMTREACMELLLVLGNCKSLVRLNLSSNSIQGCLNYFSPHPKGGFHSLQELCLNETRLDKDDVLHLTQLLKNRLPCLKELDLRNDHLDKAEEELENLVLSPVTNHSRNLQLKLCLNSLSEEMTDKCRFLCNNSSVELSFELQKFVRKENESISLKTQIYGVKAKCNNELVDPSGDIYLDTEALSNDLVANIVMSEPPPVNRLIIRDCFISDGRAFRTLILQPFCKSLSVLDLGGTNLGFYAEHVNDIITVSRLKELSLRDCQIPPPICSQMIATLFACKNITHLNMSGNTLSNCEIELPDAILAWGPKPLLQELDLSQCSLSAKVSGHLLSALGRCKQLKTLQLQGNTLTTSLSSFLQGSREGLRSLGKLFLNSTSLCSDDMSHLVKLIEKRKLPMLEELNFGSNALHTMEAIIENLVEACVTHHINELQVNLCFNDFSDSFEEKCRSLCDGTSIQLRYIEHGIDYPWREDEFLEEFYDSEETDDDDMEIGDDTKNEDEEDKKNGC